MSDAGDLVLPLTLIICFLIQAFALSEIMKRLKKVQKTLEKC